MIEDVTVLVCDGVNEECIQEAEEEPRCECVEGFIRDGEECVQAGCVVDGVTYNVSSSNHVCLGKVPKVSLCCGWGATSGNHNTGFCSIVTTAFAVSQGVIFEL